jgi:predicted acyl esterase
LLFVLRSRRIKVMEIAVRIYTSHDEMKADEYRYWQSRAAHERMEAVTEISVALYAMKGWSGDVRRLQGPVVCLQRPRR